MTSILVLAAAALGTWCLRVAFVAAIDIDTLPAVVRESLRYVGPAVTAAIAISTLAAGEGHAGLRISVAELVGLAVAGIVALRTGRLVWALAGAMASFWMISLLP